LTIVTGEQPWKRGRHP